MCSLKEALMNEIEKSLWNLTEENLRYLCECSGIGGLDVKGMNHRLLRRNVMEEMWDRTESVRSEQQGMSWLRQLIERVRRIQKGESGAPKTPGQADDEEDAIECGEKWKEVGGARLPSNRQKERREIGLKSVGVLLKPHVYLGREKPHRCSECGKAYKMADCLERHLRTHIGEKPFVCACCGKALSNSANLKIHMREIHPEESVVVNRQSYHGNGPTGEGKDMRDNTDVIYLYSMTLEEQGISFLKDDLRNIKVNGTSATESPNQAIENNDDREGNVGCDIKDKEWLASKRLKEETSSPSKFSYHGLKDGEGLTSNRLKEGPIISSQSNHDDTAECDEKWNQVEGDTWPRNKVEAESSPIRKQTEQKKSDTASTLLTSPGRASPSSASLRLSVQLDDSQETQWQTGRRPQKTTHTMTLTEPRSENISGNKTSSHICDHCGKDFVSSTNLKMHLLYLSGEKPHVCSLCGKGFVQTSCLKRHLRTHTGEKPYVCSHCGKAWSDSGNLKRHIRKTHPGEEDVVKRQGSQRSISTGNIQEFCDNTSMRSDELGTSWLLRLKEDGRKNQEDNSAALMTHNQAGDKDEDDYDIESGNEELSREAGAWLPSNRLESAPMSSRIKDDDHTAEFDIHRDWLNSNGLKKVPLCSSEDNGDDTADCDEQWNKVGGARRSSDKVEAESSPVTNRAEQRESEDKFWETPKNLWTTLGHASSNSPPTHGLKRGSVHLTQTITNTGETSAMSLPAETWNEIASGNKTRCHICEHCGKDFVTATNLKTHLLYLSGEKPHMCSLCGKRFVQSSCLKRHLRTHTGEKPYVCPRCGKAWSDSGNLKRHIRKQHPGEENVVKRQDSQRIIFTGNVEDVWDNAYSTSEDLGTAQLLQLNEDARNNQKGDGVSLMGHIEVHGDYGASVDEEGNREGGAWLPSNKQKAAPLSPSQCDDKPADFDVKDRDWLTSNELKEEPMSPHQSNQGDTAECDEKWNQVGGARWSRIKVEAESSPGMNRAEQRESEVKLFQTASTLLTSPDCASPSSASLRLSVQLDDCQETLWQTGRRPQKTTHTMTLTETCSENISGNKTSSHICDHCGKDFVSSTNLKTHLLYLSGEKPHVCSLCGKGFVQTSCLKRHLRTHTGEKPYVCSHCGKAWSDSGNLKRHIRKIHPGEENVVKRRGIQGSISTGIITEVWDNAYSMNSDELGTSRLHCLKWDARNIKDGGGVSLMGHIEVHGDFGASVDEEEDREGGAWLFSNKQKAAPLSPSQCDDDKPADCDAKDRDWLTSNELKEEPMSPNQSNQDDTAECDEKWNQVGGARWSRNKVEAESSPGMNRAEQKESEDKLFQTASTLLTSPGRASPSSASLRLSVQLDDCRETLWQTGRRPQKTTHTMTLTEPCSENISENKTSSHICDHCGKDFVSSTNLKTHLLYLSGEKPHVCSLCGKGFVQTSCLKRHVRTHTGEKPYVCPCCGKAWSDSGNLKRHIRKTHPGEENVMKRRGIQRSISTGNVEEVWDNAYLTTEDLGIPGNSDGFEAGDYKVKREDKDREWLASDWQEADTPLKTPEQRMRDDKPSQSPSSPGRVSSGRALLPGLKKVSVWLVDCRNTMGQSDRTLPIENHHTPLK
ncbi:hypothetical protein UPYG_G00055430 [Umbra pygmaea]|uniref:C2H2-type domain-containing protein n=1 Tax=Umbra pygmaea TaxID=75934 RepID=A0ABD0XQ51_UMBPY